MNDKEDQTLVIVRLVDGINNLLAGQPMAVACTALATAVTTQVVCLGSTKEEWDRAADNMRFYVGKNLENSEMIAWIQSNTRPISNAPGMKQ